MGTRDEGTPILSAMAGEPQFRERLEAFVIALGERVDQLQDLEGTHAWKELQADARRLAEEAQALGFEPLREASVAVEQASAVAQEQGSSRPDAAVREALLALTDVARRVRLGHRGSMP
ncbi:MAG TPA: hypothetical protein VEG67_06550 [Myxococcota bacterium]|nr:hypothetical protein [Myxococcota bacterium]